MEDFYRRIKLKAYFKNKEGKHYKTYKDLFTKSKNKKWVPTNNHHSIETKKSKEIQKLKYTSMSLKENKVLKELQSRNNIIITNADKGGAVTHPSCNTALRISIKDFFSKCDQIRSFIRILLHLLKKSLMKDIFLCSVNDYIKEAEWQLHNTENYKK